MIEIVLLSLQLGVVDDCDTANEVEELLVRCLGLGGYCAVNRFSDIGIPHSENPLNGWVHFDDGGSYIRFF